MLLFECSPLTQKQLPALLFFLMCFIFWLNFENFWSDHISPVEYPIIFLAIALAITFAPFPILYHRSRRWFLIAHVRRTPGTNPDAMLTVRSGDLCSPVYILWNQETSGLEMCSALSPILWGYARNALINQHFLY